MRKLGQSNIYIAKQTGTPYEIYHIYVGQWRAGAVHARTNALGKTFAVDLYEAEKSGFPTFDMARAYVEDVLAVEVER